MTHAALSEASPNRVCVIGAGPAGLAVARALLRAGVPFDVFERGDRVGGIWDTQRPGSPVYESAHFISSRQAETSRFGGHPFSRDVADYPSRIQVRDYLERFATATGVRPHIRFGADVTRVEPDGTDWLVTLDGQPPGRYRAVVCASGSLSEPNMPEVPGRLDGRVRHSTTYHSARELAGKRVLVVGAGNSGVDIACDAARVAERTLLSLRRGYWFFPKHIAGIPTDVVLSGGARLPEWLRPPSLDALLELVAGNPAQFGLASPEHPPLASHPIMNSEVLHHLGHGRIDPRPAVDRFDGPVVRFADGSDDEVDEVILATGYRAALPYLAEGMLRFEGGHRPELYLTMFSREHSGLYAVGMIETNSGVFGLFDRMGALVAAHLCAEPGDRARIDELIATDRPDLALEKGTIDSPRHRGYVDSATLQSHLDRLMAIAAPAAPDHHQREGIRT